MSTPSAALLAVRKAAVLAHWVPGFNLLVSQSDWTGLMVTTTPWDMGDGWWMPVDPCTFRREVVGLPERPSRIVGPTLGADCANLHIEVVTSGSTRYDDAGLFTVAFDEHHSAVGFSALASVAIGAADVSGTPEPPTCQWDLDGPPQLLQNIDLELGVKLVSCCYPTDDDTRARLAWDAMLGVMVTAGADEVATVAASL